MENHEHFTSASLEPITREPYRELTGSLIYLANSTRPDIAYAARFLGRYSTSPQQCLWTAGKRELRYLKGTINKHTEETKWTYMDL